MAPRDVAAQGALVKAATRAVGLASTDTKNAALLNAADVLLARSDQVLRANGLDVAAAEADESPPTVVDRLRLTPARLEAMADGMRQVAALPDPIGEVLDGWVRPNGLRIQRVRVPLGVIGIIYENRPNVTSDAAALCLKSGNAVLLRGSSSAIGTNTVIAGLLGLGLEKAGLPEDAVGLVT